MIVDADALLAGPRGRGMLLHLLDDRDVQDLLRRADAASHQGDGWFMGLSTHVTPGVRGLVDRVRTRRERVRHMREMRAPVLPSHLAEAIAKAPVPLLTEGALVDALAHTVFDARRYRTGDAGESVASDPEVRRALDPLARLVAAHPFASSWGEAAPQQWEVVKRERGGGGPEVPGAGDMPRTTSWWRGLGPFGLYLTEDNYGSPQASATPVGEPPARTFEVTGADAWARLCRDYPLDVTSSQGARWSASFGFDGQWILPDWSALSVDWDAVHLTIAGYLAAAYRPLQVRDGAASVIEGWNPDETVWLTGRPSPTGAPVAWHRYDLTGWREAAAHDQGNA